MDGSDICKDFKWLLLELAGINDNDDDAGNDKESPKDGQTFRKGETMIAALNFKQHDSGGIRGFFDLRYHGMTIKGCRLMKGKDGLWVAFPSQRTDVDGQVKYFDQVFLAQPELNHVRRLVLMDLQRQGCIELRPVGKPGGSAQQTAKGNHRTLEGEDLSQYYAPGGDDDIPF